MATHYLDQDDASFIGMLEDSIPSVWKAAQWLSSKGYNVTIRPTHIRPDASQHKDYSDDGDLEIIQKVEVKHRDVEFTCKEDYPWDTVFVDSVYTWDNKKQKPYGYIIFNSDMTACIIVEGRTSEYWNVVERPNKFKNYATRKYYECPIELCRFYDV